MHKTIYFRRRSAARRPIIATVAYRLFIILTKILRRSF